MFDDWIYTWTDLRSYYTEPEQIMHTFEIVWFFWWLIGFVSACLLEMKLLKLSALPKETIEIENGVSALREVGQSYSPVSFKFGLSNFLRIAALCVIFGPLLGLPYLMALKLMHAFSKLVPPDAAIFDDLPPSE